METAHAKHMQWRQCIQSTWVETAHAEHMLWRQRMRSTCDGDSECIALAVETAHAEHM